jgi:DNA-directed RNA polymerase specialized sigma24 family protein
VSESAIFRDLLIRVRAGDQRAATDLVRQLEPELRRAVHVRLGDPRLRRVVDSVDVCQSVLANFFVRVRLGEFDLARPEQLLNLLMAMTRNKLQDRRRRQQAQKRDQRRVEGQADGDLDALAGTAPEPGRIVAWRDLLCEVRKLLTDEERRLADHRAEGREWPEIAALVGGQPDALRKKLNRALDRVTAHLGLEVGDHA